MDSERWQVYNLPRLMDGSESPDSPLEYCAPHRLTDHAKTKTPCIGICSTTSLGDLVCRGCKRYGFEVINWNGYDAEAKQAVLSRIEKFTVQILSARFQVFSETALKRGLEQQSIPFNPALSSYCWLHNLLKKGGARSLT